MLKKGSAAAKAFMAKIRAAKGKKKTTKKVNGYEQSKLFDKPLKKQTGTSNIAKDKKFQAKEPGKRKSASGRTYYESRANRSDKGKLLGVGSSFDTSIIFTLDDLKKQYYKLAKKYHPDSGGTTIQFQQLQKDYEALFNKLLKGSSLNDEQANNEINIDSAIRQIIDILINYENLNIEVVGKWLWVSGDTYVIKDILKSVGLTFIKKANVPYWVYKGSETTSRGKMSLEEIKKKYGSTKFDQKPPKKLDGYKLTTAEKTKLKSLFSKLKKGLNIRPI